MSRGRRARPDTSHGALRAAICALMALAAGSACVEGPTSEPERARMSLVATLGGADTAGYARAVGPRAFSFPRDHGPHPEYRTEWWYVTGNLSGGDGRAFGFQLTIFRNALAPSGPGGPSDWATNQAYMGHFALTDAAEERFHAFELFARGAAGLAGARSDPFAVWIEDWTLESVSADGATFPVRLRADGDGAALDLTLGAGKPVVLQGNEGLSRKGPEPGNASYYYSLTRMPARGTVVVDGRAVAVEGLAWLDREWSTSALSPGQVGWDWFALQLDDGWEMMVYQLRREDGTPDPLSDGVLIDPEGERHALEWGSEVLVEPTDTWRSPVDGTVYPSGWRIRVPERGWDLRVVPVLQDQELPLAFRYWEGAVRVEGSGEGAESVEGRGYVELTGYDGALGAR
jgi:predicted secreted hydrolase